jgi:hypothetical protein
MAPIAQKFGDLLNAFSSVKRNTFKTDTPCVDVLRLKECFRQPGFGYGFRQHPPLPPANARTFHMTHLSSRKKIADVQQTDSLIIHRVWSCVHQQKP